MRAQPRIARSVPKAKRQPDPRRAAAHLTFVRQLPCLLCGAAAPSEAAHVRRGTDGGTGVKPSDKFALPLCGGLAGCHARQHRVGEETFWGQIGIDPVDQASRLWTVSGNIKDGERIVFRAHQSIGLRRMRR